MTKTAKKIKTNPRGKARIGHTSVAVVLLVGATAAIIFLFSKFGLTAGARSSYRSFVTVAPAPVTATPAPTVAPTSDEILTEEPTATAEATPVPSPAPEADYVKTAVVVDGNSAVVLASRQAAEELINSAVLHFELLCPGTGLITEIENKIEYQNAPESAETVSFDEAFALMTGESTPLSVRTSFARNDLETIPHETVISESGDYYDGTRFVASYGRDGKKLQLREYTYINGVLENLVVAEESVLCEPANEIVFIGSRPIPEGEAVRDFGFADCPESELSFISPVNAPIGKFFGFHNGEMHRGVDFDCPLGTDCTASCGGTVSAVLPRGSMGLTVEISHGGGFVTRYAMLENASVSVGDALLAGDTVGTVGASGLHFEIIASSRTYNPLFYIEP